jgi:hypothetical protein
MTNPFSDIFNEATEMFDISARMASEETERTEYDPVVANSLMDLTRSCKRLMLTAKKRAQE